MENKVWFITGISSGLGKALAAEVIGAGEFVIGSFRKPEEVAAFNAAYPDKAHGVLLDISEEQQIKAVVSDVISRYGKIDVLVNNAGLGFVGAVEETSMAELRHVFETNFFGTYKLTQEVLPHMRRAAAGHIIQISSHGGLKAFAGFGAYNASKFALEGFSEALAQEISPLGIHLSIVEPGPFRTGFAARRLGLAAVEIEAYAATAGAFRAKLKGVDGKQEGDPAKAATAIYELTRSVEPPLRLPLGKTALLTIGMKLDSVQNDLDAAKEIAAAAVFEE